MAESNYRAEPLNLTSEQQQNLELLGQGDGGAVQCKASKARIFQLGHFSATKNTGPCNQRWREKSRVITFDNRQFLTWSRYLKKKTLSSRRSKSGACYAKSTLRPQSYKLNTDFNFRDVMCYVKLTFPIPVDLHVTLKVSFQAP